MAGEEEGPRPPGAYPVIQEAAPPVAVAGAALQLPALKGKEINSYFPERVSGCCFLPFLPVPFLGNSAAATHSLAAQLMLRVEQAGGRAGFAAGLMPLACLWSTSAQIPTLLSCSGCSLLSDVDQGNLATGRALKEGWLTGRGMRNEM